jgi:hypothetical protein
MNDPAARRALLHGWLLLAVFLPLGLTLEALHALKVQVYFGSVLRRELWTLAHAHGTLLGILALAYAGIAERAIVAPARRQRIGTLLIGGAWLMPIGFLLGGVLNGEGDPSLFILVVPVGGILLLTALIAAAVSTRSRS